MPTLNVMSLILYPSPSQLAVFDKANHILSAFPSFHPYPSLSSSNHPPCRPSEVMAQDVAAKKGLGNQLQNVSKSMGSLHTTRSTEWMYSIKRSETEYKSTDHGMQSARNTAYSPVHSVETQHLGALRVFAAAMRVQAALRNELLLAV